MQQQQCVRLLEFLVSKFRRNPQLPSQAFRKAGQQTEHAGRLLSVSIVLGHRKVDLIMLVCHQSLAGQRTGSESQGTDSRDRQGQQDGGGNQGPCTRREVPQQDGGSLLPQIGIQEVQRMISTTIMP